jgi:hypothetical protein
MTPLLVFEARGGSISMFYPDKEDFKYANYRFHRRINIMLTPVFTGELT